MTERMTCGTCLGLGLVHVNDTETSCPDCQGKGSIEYETTYRLTTEYDSVYNVVQYKRDTDMWGKRIEWVLDSNGNPMTFTDKQTAYNMAKRLSNRWYDMREIDYSADSGDFDTASRITPDPCEPDYDSVTAELTAEETEQKEIEIAWWYKDIMQRLYGYHSPQESRAWHVWACMVDYSPRYVAKHR